MKRDAASEQLANEVAEAREALVDSARRDPERWWFAYELKDQARNGWSSSAMSMALTRLIDTDVFELQGDRIRLRR
jgi:hypothetical protein